MAGRFVKFIGRDHSGLLNKFRINERKEINVRQTILLHYFHSKLDTLLFTASKKVKDWRKNRNSR